MYYTKNKKVIAMKARTKLWLTENDKSLIGEGKAALLQTIDEEGSLNKACKKLNISYKHAWQMLRNIEESAGQQIVTTVRGGREQGTFLTPYAKELVHEYQSKKTLIHETLDDETFWESVGLKITARNQMPGRVVDVENGDVISKVTISIQPTVVTSVITHLRQYEIKSLSSKLINFRVCTTTV
jgi:molybdate transport system regulatory protein